MKKVYLIALASLMITSSSFAQNSIEEYLREYPNQEQVKMMNTWLEKNEKGTFQFTGLVDPSDATVVSPQATVDYGYNWFSVSDGPAVIKVPKYDKHLSVSIFDMRHNIPAVIVNPNKPILIKRPGQEVPDGDFTVVELETDQGLAFTRTVVVDNMKEVRKLSKSIVMEGGKGDMIRNVQRFSPEVEKNAHIVMDALFPTANADDAFGKVTGDIDFIIQAVGVKYGQLGIPSDVVRYGQFTTDSNGEALNGKNTYIVTVPAGLVGEGGYYSVTLYGMDNKLLIPNDKKIYDRTTYSSEPNDDGTYTLTLSPSGDGKNGIPSGNKDFYISLRAYVPTPGAVMKIKIEKK